MNDSAAGRLAGALIAPASTFDSIVQRPTWVLAMVVVALLNLAVSFIAVQHMDAGDMVRQQLEKSGRTLTPEQVEQQVEMAKKISAVAVWLPLVFTPLLYLAVAGIYWLGLRLLGGELPYPVSLSVALHGMLPQAIALLLAIPLMLNHGLLTIEDQRRGVVASSLAFAAPQGTSPALLALLGSVDLFTIWSLVLLVMGYRRASRLSTALTSGVVLGVFALYLLGKIGLTAAFAR